MTADVLNEGLDGRRRRGYRAVSKSRALLLAAVGLSVLIHAIGLWLLIERPSLVVKAMSSDAEGRMIVSLAPPVAHPLAQPSLSRPAVSNPKDNSPKHSAVTKRIRKKAIDRVPNDASKAAPKTTQPDAAPRDLSPPDDMFTQLEAARKRRADAQAQAGAREPETVPPTQNDNSVALANIATSLRHARRGDQANNGGVFEVRRVGYREAEFVFRGWSTNSGRNSTRLITVAQGADVDIETAVVKKIIDVIREEKTGDFLWDSHRLGQVITLSARVQDTTELQQFLLREFFPNYLPLAPRR